MVGVSCRACGDGQPGAPAWGDGESCPGGGRSVLQGPWGAMFFREPGAPARVGRGVQPRGWLEFPAGPAGMDNRAHRHWGMGSPAQGVVGASCRARGDVEPGKPAWGDGESSPGGGRSFLQGLRGWTTGRTGLGGWGVLPRGCSKSPARPVGGHVLQRTGRTGPGGTGSPAQGVVGVSCRACGDGQPGPPALGDGESCPGGGRSVLQGPWGRRTGPTGLGGWGVKPRGRSEFPAGPAGMDNRAHRPGGMGSPAQGVVGVSCRDCGEVDSGTPARGDGESCPGVGRSVLLGLWGGRCGHTAPGGRGLLPRGWLECPAGPVGT